MDKRSFRLLAVFLLIFSLFWSCTDLEEKPQSLLTPNDFYKTAAEVDAAVYSVYGELRAFSWGEPMFLQEVASDEIFIPQRGGDWGDGDVWKDLHRHTWSVTHGMVNASWERCFRGVARANSVLDNLANSPVNYDEIPTYVAEVRVLRAYYYWWLIDLFGPVPLFTEAFTDVNNPPAQNSRQEVYQFIVDEITAARSDLEVMHDDAGYGRVTKGAADAILASVYLNAEVYTGTANWDACIAACDNILNSSMYDLLPSYADNFLLSNEGPGNVETIWAVGHLAADGVGFNRHMASLHYNQLPQTPWNGWSVVTDFYNRYDTDDVRTDHLLVGQQFWLAGPNAGQPTTDRADAPLIFTPTINDLDVATEGEGVRILKWEVDDGQSGGNAGNDLALFRYSQIMLTKAEALLRQGGNNTGVALDLVNQVRERCFDPDKPLTAVTLDDILNERGFELLWENVRRQDLIRHGKYNDAWTHKNASAATRQLYPIPQAQLDANPNLQQNPGY